MNERTKRALFALTGLCAGGSLLFKSQVPFFRIAGAAGALISMGALLWDAFADSELESLPCVYDDEAYCNGCGACCDDFWDDPEEGDDLDNTEYESESADDEDLVFDPELDESYDFPEDEVPEEWGDEYVP